MSFKGSFKHVRTMIPFQNVWNYFILAFFIAIHFQIFVGSAPSLADSGTCSPQKNLLNFQKSTLSYYDLEQERCELSWIPAHYWWIWHAHCHAVTCIKGSLLGSPNPGWHLTKWPVGEATWSGAEQSLVQVQSSIWPSAWTDHSSK